MAENTEWMTSFYYQQDLRSYYMNGLLNASLKPGIYGANMSVFASDSDSSGEDGRCEGINLYIKKGTTFIFSNNYKKGTKGTGIERDLNGIGSYLIKSVALNDIIVPLAKISSGAENTSSLLGVEGKKSEATRAYVVATLLYDASQGSSSSPSFSCFFNNPSYSSEGAVLSASRYFSGNGTDGGGSTGSYLPDSNGGTISAQESLSYLICGVITSASRSSSDSLTCYLNAAGTAWNSSGSFTCNSWNENHVFLGRGLPDYRHTLSSDSLGETPDVLTDTGNPGSEITNSPTYKKVYLDLKDSLLNGRIIKNSIDVSNIYCWGPNNYVPGSSSLGVDIKSYEETDLKKRGVGYYVLCDLIYLSACFKKSGEMSDDILLNLLQNESSNNVSLKDYSWVSKVSSIGAYAEKSNSAVKSNLISNTWTYGSATSSPLKESIFPNNIVLLDVSEINQTRLIDLIRNRDILGPVINQIRRAESDASEDTLVPIALIFRAFTVGDNNGEKTITYADKFTSASQFNPTNLLSFLDLQYKSHKINVLNANVDNVYNVLAVVE